MDISQKEERELRMSSFKGMKNILGTQTTVNAVTNIKVIDENEYRFFRIDKLAYDNEFPHREAMENVLAAMNNPEYNFVYVITGGISKITIHIGVCKNVDIKNKTPLYAGNFGDILDGSFKGNFNGSELKSIDDTDDFIATMDKYTRVSLITGVPSINQEDKNNIDYQGIDRLINGCFGSNWRIVIVCEPVGTDVLNGIRRKIYDIYSILHRMSQKSIQISNGYQDGTSEDESHMKSDAHTENKSGGTVNGETLNARSDHQVQKSGNKGWAKSDTETTQTSLGKGKTHSANHSEAVTEEWINKELIECQKYIDDVLLERMKIGISKGMYRTSVYAMSDNNSDLMKLQSLFCSIFQGGQENFNPLRAINLSELNVVNPVCVVKNLQNDQIIFPTSDVSQIIFGHAIDLKAVGTSTLLNAKEISLIAGIPMKEIPGIKMFESVDFGLNAEAEHEGDGSVKIGYLLNKGQELKHNEVILSKKVLSKHVFVAGVTGSGKTTTCQKILIESKLPFLVIEPAKTEYRTMLNRPDMKELEIFTIGNESNTPLRLNPFEILKGENITSHIDMLTASFTTAFPMEAALPQIFEECVVRCYQKYGWNLDNNTNRYTDNPYNDTGMYFPIISDLVNVIPEVVTEKGFGNLMEGDYIGSLKGRISNLLVGSKGRMLNCRKSLDFETLLDMKVIIELEDLKSPNDKSFIMGILLARIAEALKIKYKNNINFQHLTLIEEAHRLLSKVESGDSGAKKGAVESFTDLLAEVRKYGEGLIIADQIPNKLAVEVLKNTNTKIIHKLFAQDDKEVIGDTMMMDDKQKEFLSTLSAGEVIIFSEGIDKPVNAKILRLTSTEEKVSDKKIMELFAYMKIKYDKLLSDSAPENCVEYYKNIEINNIYEDYVDFIKALKKTDVSIGEKYKYDEIVSFQNECEDEDKKKEKRQIKDFKEFIISAEELSQLLNDMSASLDISKKDIWVQLSWKYMVKNNIVMSNYKIWNKVYQSFCAFYEIMMEEYIGRKVYNIEAVRKFKNII